MGITVTARKPKNISPLKYAKQAAYKRHTTQAKADRATLGRYTAKKGQLEKEMFKAKAKYGEGSRKSYEATKKYKDMTKTKRSEGAKAKLEKKREDEHLKDLRLIGEYGADAMQARGFGTTYPKVKRNMGGPAKKRKNKSKVFSGNDYVREVNHYKEM